MVESGTIDKDEWTYEWFLEVIVGKSGFPPLMEMYESFFVQVSWERLVLSNSRWHRGLKIVLYKRKSLCL